MCLIIPPEEEGRKIEIPQRKTRMREISKDDTPKRFQITQHRLFCNLFDSDGAFVLDTMISLFHSAELLSIEHKHISELVKLSLYTQ